ncbi:MAG TPA: M15 family metallopeptidase [Actinomycetota bacterium]|nr:M15 family metallopeptidase [Actinomycetota bacterium]
MKTRALLVCLALLVACGGRQQIFREPPDDDAVEFELPEPVPASPAYVARLSKPLKGRRLEKVSHTPGVAVLTPVSVRRFKVRGPQGPKNMRVASVDPLPFRSVAPPSTRDAEFVWLALFSDQAVLTFEAAKALGVTSAQEVTVGKTTVKVGAFADNGMPNLADMIVSTRVARAMKLGAPTVLVVGAKTGTTIETLGKDLRRKLPGADLKRIRVVTSSRSQPAAPQPTGTVSGATIGTMSFRILKNGFIDPDDSWVAANITSASVPILGTVRCHRIMIPQLGAALAEIEDAGLAGEIRPSEYAGCYVPRFIDRDPRRGLSMHAFGLAVDLNTSTNQLGTRGDMHPDVVRIFEKWGFGWGGWWQPRPDPMHFELARIVRP